MGEANDPLSAGSVLLKPLSLRYRIDFVPRKTRLADRRRLRDRVHGQTTQNPNYYYSQFDPER
jgi:hypothetical protein